MSKHLVRLVAAVGLAGAMLGTAAAEPNRKANCTAEYVQSLTTVRPGFVPVGFARPFAQTGGPGGSVVGEESRTNCGER